jgi:hypothetical protein
MVGLHAGRENAGSTLLQQLIQSYDGGISIVLAAQVARAVTPITPNFLLVIYLISICSSLPGCELATYACSIGTTNYHTAFAPKPVTVTLTNSTIFEDAKACLDHNVSAMKVGIAGRRKGGSAHGVEHAPSCQQLLATCLAREVQ